MTKDLERRMAQTAALRRFRAAKKAQGICVHCFKVKAREFFQTCEACALEHRARAARKKLGDSQTTEQRRIARLEVKERAALERVERMAALADRIAALKATQKARAA